MCAVVKCCFFQTRFYDNVFANMPTMDVLRIAKGYCCTLYIVNLMSLCASVCSNYLTHWWLVLQHCWSAKLDYDIPGTEIRKSVLQSKR